MHPSVVDNPSRQVDLRCVFDTTGSMSNKIASLVEAMAEIVASLGQLQLDWRFGVVPFGDLTVPSDRIVTDLPESRDVATAQRQLRSLPRFSGGSNLGESSGEAVIGALQRPFRPNAVKIVVLLTDEPALGVPVMARLVAQALGAAEALCFTITPDYDYFRAWAVDNGGTWQPISSTIDARSLLRTFEEVMDAAIRTAATVHQDYGGSVRRYLTRAALPPSTRANRPAPVRTRRMARVNAAPGLPAPAQPSGDGAPGPRLLTRADDDALPPGRRLGTGER